MSKTLLEKAKSIQSNRKGRIQITEEHEDLAMAWVKGQIGLSQVARAIDRLRPNGLADSASTYAFLAIALRHKFSKNGKP